MRRTVQKCFDALASYGLSVVLLLLLAVLTLLGTLEQVDRGLYEVQHKYFASLFLVHDLFGVIPVPLPGAYLLLALLSVNLFCGGIVRARKGVKQIGILIGHAGILALLVGAFFSFHYSLRGHVTLQEGDALDVFMSYDEYELAVARLEPAAEVTEFVIPQRALRRAAGGGACTFHHAGLPFEVTVSDYVAHSGRPQPAPGASDAVDGFRLAPQPPEKDVERNVPGLRVALHGGEGDGVHEALMWGMARTPYFFEAGGEAWALDLRKRLWPLPFEVRLDRFTFKRHPGTHIPSAFVSDVTVVGPDGERASSIKMNEPLRQAGYTLYQASYGPAGGESDERYYSTLAVVRDPAEQIPRYACIVILAGLCVHFAVKLIGYLRAEARRKA